VDYSAMSPEALVLSCLRGGDEAAWVEFVARFHPLIASAVLRVARQWGVASPQVVDDLVQETYLKLCADRRRLLQNFESTHENSVFGYIKVFTANLAHDHFKASRSLKRGGASVTGSTDCSEPDERQQMSGTVVVTPEIGVLIREIDECLEGVTYGPNAERDRRIFWLYYRVGLASSAIAALPTIGLSVKGVESTLQRLTRQVRQRLVPGRLEDPKSETSGKGIPSAESL